MAPGGAREGWGHGLTLGSIDDLCVCVSQGFSIVLFKFPVVWIHATWVGRRAALSTKNSQSTNRRISAASNWCTISPCRSRPPAVERTGNSLWWFSSLHWHSFTLRLLLPIYLFALISHTRRHLALSLQQGTCDIQPNLFFWQMYNATCFSLCILHVDHRGEASETDPRLSRLLWKSNSNDHFLKTSTSDLHCAASTVHV